MMRNFFVGRREPGTAAPLPLDGTAGGSTYNTGSSHDGKGGSVSEEAKVGRNGDRGTLSVGTHRHLRPPASVRLEPVTVRGRPLATGDRVRGPTVSTPPLRKLLFSATLTSNPQKLAGLDVVNPLIYTARERTRPMAGRRAGVTGGGGGVARMEGGVGDGEAKRPSQETRRSNLDDVGVDGKRLGRYSTPATLQETYTVCESQVRSGLGVGGAGTG